MSASRRQVGMLHSVLGQLGITERPEKLRVVSAVIYRPINTTNDLSRDEAHVCIDTLQGMDREQVARFVESIESRADA